MKLIIASNNAHKIAELREMLLPYFTEILSMREAGIAHETVEDQATFAGNAIKKARELHILTGSAALADDSGLEVDALDGAPGVYSARFAGEHGNDAANNALLLEKLHDLPAEKRTARFRSVVALIEADGSLLLGEGTAEGVILEEEAGQNGFGYDPLFYVPEMGATFAQLTSEQKNTCSHRDRAVEDLCKKLRERKST